MPWSTKPSSLSREVPENKYHCFLWGVLGAYWIVITNRLLVESSTPGLWPVTPGPTFLQRNLGKNLVA